MWTVGKRKKRRYGLALLENEMMTAIETVTMSPEMTYSRYSRYFSIQSDGRAKRFQRGSPMSDAGMKYGVVGVCACHRSESSRV